MTDMIQSNWNEVNSSEEQFAQIGTGGIVFIDPSVEDYQSLIAGAVLGTEVFVLDSTRDGVEQITEVLAGRSGVSSVHIVSHGGSGSLQLGRAQLSLDTLDNYASQLQDWAGSLAEQADILLYGCDVAAGDMGTSFVNQLSRLTGADVAASTDLTGGAALGGDWDLEVVTDEVEAPLAFQLGAMEAYTEVLAATITTLPSWDGGSGVVPIGEPDTATYGQTFTVPDGNSVLNSFEIYLNDHSNPDAIDFGFYVMAWDGTKATGPILYESSKQTSAGSAGFEKFTFNTGNLNLNSGQKYVAFVSASKFFDGINGTGTQGFISSDVYSGGDFVYYNNGSDFNALTTNTWDMTGSWGADAAFTASFSAPINSAPALTGIKATLIAGSEDTNYTISATDLLTGFTDVDADSLSVSNLSATNGTLVDNKDGTWNFNPNANYNGSVNLSYNVTDGNGGSKSATQSFTLAAVNDAPTGTATAKLAAGSEDAGYTISATDLLTGFTDIDGDNLSVADIAATNGTLGAYDATNGTWSFNPNDNYNGNVNLSYNVNDGNGGSKSATQSFTLAAVNDAPTGTATAKLAAGSEDTNYTIRVADVLAGFTDVDGDILSVSNLSVSNGTLGAYDTTNGTWSFKPNDNYNGSVNLSYNVTDGNGGSKAASQSFTLAAVNDAPNATNDQVATSKGTAVTVELGDNVFDIEGLTGAILATTDAVGGTVTLIDSDAQQITFTPGSSFVGTASFKYTITDAGSVSSNTATVTVDVGDIVSTGNQSQTVTGNNGNDYISAGNGKDVISGLGGADTLLGNNGADIISGGSGIDKIWGGNGDDLLDGGSGSDQIIGGNGSDRFVIAAQSGTDTITDFVAGTDLIGLSGGISFGSLSFSGNNILLTSTNETLATLTGVNTSTLNTANFVNV